MRSQRRALGSVAWSLGLVALLGVAGYSAYFAFSTRLNGGAAYSGFSVTLTQPTTKIAVPRGDVLVVIPHGIENNPSVGFEPQSLKVELGVNNTILFANEDNNIHIIQSLSWPVLTPGFDLWLTPGETGTVKLNYTGTYVYNFDMVQAAENGTITVVSG